MVPLNVPLITFFGFAVCLILLIVFGFSSVWISSRKNDPKTPEEIAEAAKKGL